MQCIIQIFHTQKCSILLLFLVKLNDNSESFHVLVKTLGTVGLVNDSKYQTVADIIKVAASEYEGQHAIILLVQPSIPKT